MAFGVITQVASEHRHFTGSSYAIPRLRPSICITITENASKVISLEYYNGIKGNSKESHFIE